MKELSIVLGAKELLQKIGNNALWKRIEKLANETYSESSWNRTEAVRCVILFHLGEIKPKPCPSCGTLFFWGKHCSWSCASRHNAIEKGLGGPLTEESKKRRKETCLKKYGVENPSQLERVQRKRKQTCVEKYGYEHPLQHPEIFQKQVKSCFKRQAVECVDGKTRTFQSKDEERVANAMICRGFNVCAPSLSIEYRVNGKISRYHPDFAVKSPKGNKLLVEVKSGYTLLADFKRNLAKFDAANRYCKQRGMKFILCVIQERGGKEAIEKFTFPTKEILEGHTWTTH